ncbi:hypothetical protein CCR80_02750 [Rhodothalassium salexigens]|uniref:MFS transporter n=1 Tax=Rhodothalassium salexigens TaxID=1086 RepID=UPI0019118D2F|nr:MFS transporter [Rhodothalassium salexigens]MBK5919957.1 hypothetical protein [Rhodothalassium salexigens]
MTRLLVSITALLLATAILLTGNGLQSVLLPVRGDLAGFSTVEIAALGSAYFAGILIGSLFVPFLVSSVGHVRTHSAMTALLCAVTLAYALLLHPWLWIALRVFYGVFLAGIYLVVESWLNERADNASRGSILSIYTIINLAMMAAGQLLINVYDPSGYELFILSALLVSLAAVPVALTRQITPVQRPHGGFKLATLTGLPRVSVIGALAGGITTGAFWGLAPVYAQAIGLGTGGVSLFLAITITGGALFQWPLGRLSDTIDRRRVIILCLIGAAVAGTFLRMGPATALTPTLAAVFAFGAFAFPLYPISAAHAIDWTDADGIVDTGTGILFLTGVGALTGPLLAATAIAFLDASALFLFTSLIHGLAAAAAVIMIATRAPIDEEDKVDFHLAPRTTPMAYELSPYGDDEAEDGDEGVGQGGGDAADAPDGAIRDQHAAE